MKVIDLSTLDTGAACDKGCEIELLHPITRAPLSQYISVVGKDSKLFREHVARTSNVERRALLASQRRAQPYEGKSFETQQEEGTELLAACTTGWRNLFYKGSEFPFSNDNARKLYAEQIWIRAQVDAAIVDVENFMKT